MKSVSGLSIFLSITIILFNYITVGQSIPEITAKELPGYILDRNECFDGESLWGYMNGGADIYLEYGFETMRVEEFSNENETIKLELFKMDDPISAFGIYGNRTFKCGQSDVIITTDCLNRFQFQLLYGDYYIQVINESGSEKAKQIMISIAELLVKKIERKELILPVKYLTDSLNLSLFDIKLVKGVLGIQNKARDLTDCFLGIADYQIYYAKTIVDEEKVKYYEIVFAEPKMKIIFLEKISDKDLQILKITDRSVLIQH